ncbi:hypothetical protein NP493_1056g01006 [Ridgeia piscesae]|uniref:Uncharacterized protein n=1 Tax=Ridgeia piscesae TaxID=27915 RepID=A0AAD9NKE7_RIDPI|nr:hypothetical protein NP493_1056g01006 [Ridgeia piscesae]
MGPVEVSLAGRCIRSPCPSHGSFSASFCTIQASTAITGHAWDWGWDSCPLGLLPLPPTASSTLVASAGTTANRLRWNPFLLWVCTYTSMRSLLLLAVFPTLLFVRRRALHPQPLPKSSLHCHHWTCLGLGQLPPWPTTVAIEPPTASSTDCHFKLAGFRGGHVSSVRDDNAVVRLLELQMPSIVVLCLGGSDVYGSLEPVLTVAGRYICSPCPSHGSFSANFCTIRASTAITGHALITNAFGAGIDLAVFDTVDIIAVERLMLAVIKLLKGYKEQCVTAEA